MTELAIVGGGSWGTALALVLAQRFQRISMWVFEADLAARMRQTRENDVYLPGFRLPPQIDLTSDLGAAVRGASIVLNVVPSHHVRRVCGEMAGHLSPGAALVSATKGVENGTLLRMTLVICDALAGIPVRTAAISGPSSSWHPTITTSPSRSRLNSPDPRSACTRATTRPAWNSAAP
jgi:glycerol-3-phosphate dehydrogenase (NAD(P)+)